MIRSQGGCTVKKICFLWTFFVFSVIGYCADTNSILFKSCTITAGNTKTADSIAITGSLTGANPDFSSSTELFVTLAYNTSSTPPPGDVIAFRFPINSKTYKNNSFKSFESNKIFSQMFQYSPKTRKFSFKAQTNLTGLSCPFNLIIEIGDYTAQGQLNETIVNGSKSCPFQLLMGVGNSLELSKKSFKLGPTRGSDTIALDGLFTVGGPFVTTNPFILTLGSQAFTVSGSAFTNKSGIYTCTNAPAAEGGLVSVKLDTNQCLFSVKIKNTTLVEYGVVNFDMAIFGNSMLGFEQIDLGPKTIFTYDELMRQNVLGAYWNYDGKYADSVEGEKDSGPTRFQISVRDIVETVPGQDCAVVYTSMVEEDYLMVSYTDQNVTYGYEYGMINDEGIAYDFFFDNAQHILYPDFLRLPYSYQETGTFTGYFDIDMGYAADTSDLTGKVTTSWKLLGYDHVTVGAGPFTNVVKSCQTMNFAGQMHLYIKDGSVYYDEDVKIILTTQNLYWSDTTAGIVKTDQTVNLKITYPGIGTFKAVTNTIGGLTDYLIPESDDFPVPGGCILTAFTPDPVPLDFFEIINNNP
jgi:hypothetical protein